MSSVIVQPPTKEVLALCDDADSLIERYLECFRACLDKPGWRVGRCRFEAEAEAYTILKLLIRHLESVCELARHDLVLLPSAIVLCRAAFEASVRVRWMLRPVDPYEREVRWVLHLRSGIKHFSMLEHNTHTPKDIAAYYGLRRQSYAQFDTEISKLLTEEGYTLPNQAPNIWEMLKDIGNPEFYQFYILLSAFTHTNFEAGNFYRKNLGNARKMGEFIKPQDWRLPLEVAWKSFFLTARDFLYWIEADMAKFSGETLFQDFESHLSQLSAG
jgi:hypothetical protein